MQGNGGTMSVDVAARHAVNTLMSGPAAGVKAAAYTALAAGHRNIISCDMGGTSFDVGVIRDGRPALSADKEMGYGLPVRVPMIDIHTIGAGGGSIARVNSAGILQVGPESAGADPGPICYGRGGDGAHDHRRQPPAGAAQSGGAARRRRGGARSIASARSSTRRSAPTSGSAPDEVAGAIVRVANDKMAGAIRLVSLQRGHDPRDFVLFAFGGAGPLHAVALARELAIPRVLVPARPGITSALGCLVADVRHDFVKTVNQDRAAPGRGRGARASWPRRSRRGAGCSPSEGVEVETVTVQHEADMQFVGQTHVLTVAIPRTDFEREDLMRAFERAYWERFEVELREMRAQVVSLRTAVIGRRRPVALEGLLAVGRRGCRRAGAGRPPARVVRRGLARYAGVPPRAARGRRRVRRARPSWSSSTPPPWSSRATACASTRSAIWRSPSARSAHSVCDVPRLAAEALEEVLHAVTERGRLSLNCPQAFLASGSAARPASLTLSPAVLAPSTTVEPTPLAVP